jgi:acyl-CoA reductase-like NAD-dependent aldehyde dehydrogenase
MLTRVSLYIDGQWRRASGGDTLVVVNPATEEITGTVTVADRGDIDHAVAAARRAFDEGPWPHLHLEERIARLEQVMALLAARIGELSTLVTDEMGAPAWMRGHFDWSQNFWHDIRDSYRAHHTEELRSHAHGDTLVVREPIGVVAGIVPWNAPILIALAKVASALITGCTCVLKPSEQTPLSAFLLADAIDAAGIPPGVFNLVPGGRDVGEALVSHPGVDMVSLTGSTAAGRRVGEICGRDFKRMRLELGGKSAAIVLEDADLAMVAQVLRWGNFISTGQACNLLSRVIVPRSRHREIVDALVENARGLRVGDPHDPKTEIGPLAIERQLDRVKAYIAQGVSEGARLVTGGDTPASMSRGWFIEPTIFDGVTPEQTIAREEIFGPVVAVMTYDDEDAAVALANHSDYGLGGTVISQDRDRAVAIARRLRTGSVGINRYGVAPNAPYGGVKQSGVGREHGPEGIEEHFVVKSIGFTQA